MKRISPLLMYMIVIFITNYQTAFSQEPEDIIIERDGVILKGKFYNALQDVKAWNVQLSPFEDDHTFSLSREKISPTICDWVKRRHEE